MPKIVLNVPTEYNASILEIDAGVRYWEDATINKIEDTNGIMPGRDGDRWKIKIDLDSGTIFNWPKGIVASIYYKICDDGIYTLIDVDGDDIKVLEGYVPRILYPLENGYGDYIIMDIDEDGKIKGWKCDLSDFEDKGEV